MEEIAKALVLSGVAVLVACVVFVGLGYILVALPHRPSKRQKAQLERMLKLEEDYTGSRQR